MLSTGILPLILIPLLFGIGCENAGPEVNRADPKNESDCCMDVMYSQERTADKCYAFNLTGTLYWPYSAVWDPIEKCLLVVEPIEQKIYRISRCGKMEDYPDGGSRSSTSASFPWARPLHIRRIGKGYLLKDEGKLISLNERGEPEISGSLIIKDIEIAQERLEAVYDLAPMSKGILAFGDLSSLKGEEWRSAFVYFDSENRGYVFRPMPIQSPERDFERSFYVLNLYYIAVLDDVGYILSMEERPNILAVTLDPPKSRRLKLPPEVVGEIPPYEYSAGYGGTKATTFYRLIEASALPLGLYAWRNNLYLLVKSEMTSDWKTKWSLYELDPETGEIRRRIMLPTTSTNLLVVPGNEYWALIEKGPVQGMGPLRAPYMETSSMVLIPSEWLTDLSEAEIARKIEAEEPCEDPCKEDINNAQ